MTVTNARREDLMKEVVEARSDRLKETMKTMVKEGPPLPGKKKTPAEKLAAYMQATVDPFPVVLDPEYEVKASLGTALPLMSPFWNMLLSLPSWRDWSAFRHHQDEFRDLLMMLDKRTGGVA